ncbi:hypothetical protein CAPTEDRAFT_216395 [Capitella teleta]|uniref:Uncharacterized protein n=1 Tax=Capitella teleta TaxID=283909 RepID=R7VE23_CAPTE|nr:hypothetical protein CAPTEDRAFT_216395 [Capitella teleta]|eukprot:ELU17088.1 hypothetical protein CAPTEDRAFT_216395 [Capitella teleta]
MVTDADSAIWFQLKVVRGQSTENRVVKAAPGTSVKNLLAHELPVCTIPRVTGKTKAGSEETDLRQDMPVDMVKEFGFLFLHAYVHGLDEAKAEPTPPSRRPSALQLLLDMSKSYTSYPPQKSGTRADQRLYNKVLEVLKQEKVGFLPIQVHNFGDELVSTLASEEYAIVRPICNSCLESGKRPVTRNALAQKRKF